MGPELGNVYLYVPVGRSLFFLLFLFFCIISLDDLFQVDNGIIEQNGMITYFSFSLSYTVLCTLIIHVHKLV